MRENFEPTAAAFMTPDAILTSATAFKDAAAAATAGDERVRVQSASMAVYWAAMPRWRELTRHAKNAAIPWPLEPTLQGAFDAFTAAFNATAKRYGGVDPVFREVCQNKTKTIKKSTLRRDTHTWRYAFRSILPFSFPVNFSSFIAAGSRSHLPPAAARPSPLTLTRTCTRTRTPP